MSLRAMATLLNTRSPVPVCSRPSNESVVVGRPGTARSVKMMSPFAAMSFRSPSASTGPEMSPMKGSESI